MNSSRKRFAPLPEKELSRQRQRCNKYILSDQNYRQDWSKAHASIFKVGNELNNSLCPPEQVFNTGYKFLFQMGGASFTTANEYNSFMNLFEQAGDESFAIVEQPEVIKTQEKCYKQGQDKFCFSTDIPFREYALAEHVMSNMYPFGLGIGHYYIFGQSAKWGFYLAECPTLLILGVIPEYVNAFQNALEIKGNGFDKSMHEFVEKECGRDGYEVFVKNYLSSGRLPK